MGSASPHLKCCILSISQTAKAHYNTLLFPLLSFSSLYFPSLPSVLPKRLGLLAEEAEKSIPVSSNEPQTSCLRSKGGLPSLGWSPELWKGETTWPEHPGAGRCCAPEGTASQLPSISRTKHQVSLGRVMKALNW